MAIYECDTHRNKGRRAPKEGVAAGRVDEGVLLTLLNGGAGEAHRTSKFLGRQGLAGQRRLVHLQTCEWAPRRPSGPSDKTLSS